VAYARAIRFEPGETLIACSICGFPYLFPSEMTYGDDQLFRCHRTCIEATRKSDLQEQVASQRRKDQIIPPLSGPRPTWRD